MSDPNCDIVLTFYEAEKRFSYHCTGCSTGWKVQPDGSIHPPSRSRVVRFHLDSYPAGASFAGFQIVAEPPFPSKDQDPWSIQPHIGVEPLPPPAFPPPSGTTTLVFDMGEQNSRLWFRLGIETSEGKKYWDEPKIYNDGSL